MSNGNGKALPTDAFLPQGIEEDEEEFDYVGEVARFDGNDELLSAGFSPAASPLESTAAEAESARDLSPASPAPPGVAALDEQRDIASREVGTTNMERPPDSKDSDSSAGSSGPQAQYAVKTAKGADRPRPGRKWLVGVLIAAILAFGGSLGFWLWPFGDLASALASVLPSNSEIAAATPEVPAPAEMPAPQSLPVHSPLDDLAQQPNVSDENFQVLQQNETHGDIGVSSSDETPAVDVTSVQSVPENQQDAAPLAIAVERLEGIESLLAGLNDRLGLLEQSQRELVDRAESESSNPELVNETPVDAASQRQTALNDARNPVRAEIEKCNAEGKSLIESLVPMQMAAHEGADGRRWIRVLAPNWRRDLTSGDRLPLRGPGELRVWVDGAGVFGVVNLPGSAPCRMEWK